MLACARVASRKRGKSLDSRLKIAGMTRWLSAGMAIPMRAARTKRRRRSPQQMNDAFLSVRIRTQTGQRMNEHIQ